MASYWFNRSIKTQLALMLPLPTAGMLYFASVAVWKKSRFVDNLHSLQSLIHLAIKASAVIHELQKERSLSTGFIGSQGEKSALSANEIDVVTRAVSQQSETLQNKVKQGVDSLHVSQASAEDVAIVMSDANKSVSDTSVGLGDIASSVKEQTVAMNDLARNVGQIAQMAEENSLAVDSVSGAALNLQNFAVALQEKIGKFHY